jgi:two-component system, NarL family, response regulator DevR
MEMTTRVFVVDDHEVIRRGIAALVKAEPDIDLVGEASSVAEAQAWVPRQQPNVAVLDVRLPDGNGVELCRDLQSRIPGLRCLMLTSYDDHEALMDAIMAGAAGFVLKGVVSEELVKAIRTAGAGKSLLSPKQTSAMLSWLRREQEQADPLRELTTREREVLDLIGQGMTNREIAQRMYLAEKTVKNYVSQLLAKLAMRHRSEAAVLATELRLDRGPQRRM